MTSPVLSRTITDTDATRWPHLVQWVEGLGWRPRVEGGATDDDETGEGDGQDTDTDGSENETDGEGGEEPTLTQTQATLPGKPAQMSPPRAAVPVDRPGPSIDAGEVSAVEVAWLA